MAAEGDNLIDSPLTPDTEVELRYIDHRECKLVSPGREKFSPANPFKTQVDQQNNMISNKADDIDVTGISKDVSESEQSDSGLDSFNVSEEAIVGKYVDHQENHMLQDKPDSITSPVKMVDDLFSFVNEPESLDAVNNNNDVSEQISQSYREDKAELFRGESYQGMEVDLHEKQQKTEVETKVMRQSSAEINLFWYNNKTVDLDPSELECFKNNGDTYTSSVNFNVGDKYFKDKLETDKTVEVPDKQQTSKKVEEKKEPKEKWSPSFESASSRFLNLASEMKSDFKPKTSAVVPSDGTSVDAPLQHPWGLDDENKVMVLPGDKAEDELLAFPNLCHESTEEVNDDVDGDVPEEDDDVDVVDSMGYMEYKDKEQIIKAHSDAEAQKKAKDVKNKDLKEASSEKSEENDDIDVSNAMEYMELKDKDKLFEDSEAQEKNVIFDGAKKLSSDYKSDEDIKIESEHIVNTVVQNVQSQMMRSSGDFRSEATSGVKRKFEQDVVDGSEVERVLEETVEVIPIQIVEPSDRSCIPMYREEIFEPMEIRRKFRMGGNVESSLVKLGASLIEEENLVDEYLDDDNYSLLLNNSWLRLRNKKFEMKVSDSLNGSSKFGAYHEIQIEKDVRQHLIRKFSDKLHEIKDQDLPLDVIVDRLGLTEFVTMETIKKSYQFEECVVGLEMTDLMPGICQLEVTVSQPSQILQALDTISRTAMILDLKPLQSS